MTHTTTTTTTTTMDDPQAELKSVVRQLVETRSASEMLEHVDKYFCACTVTRDSGRTRES